MILKGMQAKVLGRVTARVMTEHANEHVEPSHLTVLIRIFVYEASNCSTTGSDTRYISM